MNRIGILVATSAVVLWGAVQPWKTDSREWTAKDVDRILSDSPWSQVLGATFALAEDDTPPPSPEIDKPQAGMPNPHNGATDGRWDGGVSRVNRNGPPTLNVTVRWDSALPVRQALERSHDTRANSPDRSSHDYIITVIGLVPAGRNTSQPRLTGSSASGEEDLRNPEEMLSGVRRYARLYRRGKPAILPDDATLDQSTGTLHIFFPRSERIAADEREVTFEMRFGSLSVSKRFRLKDMFYEGQLAL